MTINSAYLSASLPMELKLLDATDTFNYSNIKEITNQYAFHFVLPKIHVETLKSFQHF